MSKKNLNDILDVIVIGGGPAGLQAALTLGRLHRRVLLLDGGRYRNDPADHLHNSITHDGRRPAEFRALAHADLAVYDTVTVGAAEVSSVEPDGPRFTVTSADGRQHARRVLLATGVRDTLPTVPGLQQLFGTVAAHCPFCHGHEYAGRPVALLGAGPHVLMQARMMTRIASSLVVLTNGEPLAVETTAALAVMNVPVRPERIVAVARHPLGARVSLDGSAPIDVGGMLVATTFTQSAPFAGQLDLELLPSGCVQVDALGRTSRPGVYAAGDCAHSAALPMPMSSVLAAAAAGQLAGSACIADEVLG